MTQSCRATSLLIVSCGGFGSRAPWRSWDDGGHHGWWVRGLASFHCGTLCVMSAVHQILSMRSFFNSCVRFGTGKSCTRLNWQDQGSQMHHKRAISSQKKISCHKSDCSLICNAILNQFMFGEIFQPPKLAKLQIEVEGIQWFCSQILFLGGLAPILLPSPIPSAPSPLPPH